MGRSIDGSRQLDEFVGHVYDAALDRRPWLAVGEELKTLIGSTTASIFMKGRDGSVSSLVRMATPQAVNAYVEEFAAHDLWHHESVKRGIKGRAARGSEAVPDSVFERSYYYNEFSKVFANDVFYCCGVVDEIESGSAVVALHRTRREGDFDDHALGVLDRVRPHLYRAFDVARRLTSVASSTGTVLSRLEASVPWGLFEIAVGGRMLRTNDLGSRMLAEGNGIACVADRLVARSPSANRRLQELIFRAIHTTRGSSPGSAGGYVSLPRASDGLSYRALVSPVGRDRVALGPGSVAALVFVSDPELVSTPSALALRDLFGLTPAEARVVAGIAAGENLRAIARASGTGYQTIRTLLGRALPKLGASSQAGVVRQLSLLPVPRT